MWVMDTDIALTSFTGHDGLNVFARSLQSAQPLAGLEVVLLTRGNEPIAKAITAADGRVNFAAGLLKGRGAAEAFAVMASDASKQEFARLELTKAAFDFSDRGISGRDQPGPVDAFLYTERGVYRPGETRAADGHAARRRRGRARQHAGDPDRQAAGRHRVHALHPRPAGLGRALPGDRPAEILASRPLVGERLHRSQGRPGRSRRILGRGFRAGEAQGRAHARPADPASRPGQQLCRGRRLPLRRAGVGPHGRGRHARHHRRPAVRRLRQIFVRLGERTQEVRAAFHHAHRARYRRDGQVAPRMGRRPGQGHGAAAARPDPGSRVRARRRPRHARRQDAADAHPRRLSRHPSDLRGPLCQRGRRDRVRHRGGRRRRQAGRPASGRVPHRAHRL